MFWLLRVVTLDDRQTTASRGLPRDVPGSCRRRACNPILPRRRREVGGRTWVPARVGLIDRLSREVTSRLDEFLYACHHRLEYGSVQPSGPAPSSPEIRLRNGQWQPDR